MSLVSISDSLAFRPQPDYPYLGEDDPMEHNGDCPACGNPIDYCPGHGEIGDPEGFRILNQHDADDHRDCDPYGCDEILNSRDKDFGESHETCEGRGGHGDPRCGRTLGHDGCCDWMD